MEVKTNGYWKQGYGIYVMGFGGTVYDALNCEAISIEENLFETNEDALEALRELNGLNKKLTFIVLPTHKFVTE